MAYLHFVVDCIIIMLVIVKVYSCDCGAACLPVLHTLQMTHNRLQSVTDIEHLVHCTNIGVLDLSHNQLDDPMILDVFKRMKSLVRCHVSCNNNYNSFA